MWSGILDKYGAAGYGGIKASDCQTKGCCYTPAPATTGAALVTLPACFYPNGGDSSFSLSGALQSSGKPRATIHRHVISIPSQPRLALCQMLLTAALPVWHPVLQDASILHWQGRGARGNTPALLHSAAPRLMLQANCAGLAGAGSAQTGSLSSASTTLPQFGPDVSPLNVGIQYITASILRVKVGAQGRWEVPATLFNVTPPTGAPAHPCRCLQRCTDPPQQLTAPRAGHGDSRSICGSADHIRSSI